MRVQSDNKGDVRPIVKVTNDKETGSTVCVYPDTNLFIQCKPLDQLDWSAWLDFDEVLLIVSRPVLREIDGLKKKGNERVGKRARSATSLFHKIITAKEDYWLIRHSGPCVKLMIRPEQGHIEGLPGLDYDERDDQLIATVHKFTATYPDRDVRLLTHDTIPLATARSLGLKADVIPDGWLLPPERTQTDKKIAALEAENARLRKAEPSLQVICQNGEGATVKRFEASYTWFEPLTETEISSLMQSLKDRFPIETDFGSRESAAREARTFGSLFPVMQEEFVPTTEEEMADYRDEVYPKWLRACERIFQNYHFALQRQVAMPAFSFVAWNNGTRPAKNALITIEARGNFEMKPPAPDGKDDVGPRSASEVSLPHPARAPRGWWRTTTSGRPGEALERFGMIGRSLARMSDPLWSTLAFETGIHDPAMFRPDPAMFRSPPRDPNGFYYKPERPMAPQSAFNLECGQWRHGYGSMTFPGEIHFRKGQDSVEGALECRIHAENLSQAVSCLVPVRISVNQIHTFERARELVKTVSNLPQIHLQPFKEKTGSSG